MAGDSVDWDDPHPKGKSPSEDAGSSIAPDRVRPPSNSSGRLVMSVYEEAELHRKVCQVLLAAHLRQRGSKRRLAEIVGITPRHLRNLLRSPVHTCGRLAHELAAALGLDSDVAESFSHHAVMSRLAVSTARGHMRALAGGSDLEAVLDEVATAHGAAMGALDATESRRLYQLSRDVTVDIVRGVHPLSNPRVYLESCMILHDALCATGRPDQAYYIAGIALMTAIHLEEESPELAAGYEVHALRAQAIALHNLGSDDHASILQEQAASRAAALGLPVPSWGPFLARERLLTMARMRRQTVRQALTLAGDGHRALWAKPTLTAGRDSAMIDEALARTLLHHGGVLAQRRAQTILRSLVDRLENTPQLGAVHRVAILRTAAELDMALGEVAVASDRLAAAARIAVQAGLSRQSRAIRDRAARMG